MEENDRVDQDQLYLARKISEAWDKELTVAALQKLNLLFGRVVVTQALRSLHGFPPTILNNPYAYIQAVCKASA
jgi:hypothetical protein